MAAGRTSIISTAAHWPNESLPHSDVFYTLNVLLGTSRVREIPDDIALFEIFRRNAIQLTTLPVAKLPTAWRCGQPPNVSDV